MPPIRIHRNQIPEEICLIDRSIGRDGGRRTVAIIGQAELPQIGDRLCGADQWCAREENTNGGQD